MIIHGEIYFREQFDTTANCDMYVCKRNKNLRRKEEEVVQRRYIYNFSIRTLP